MEVCCCSLFDLDLLFFQVLSSDFSGGVPAVPAVPGGSTSTTLSVYSGVIELQTGRALHRPEAVLESVVIFRVALIYTSPTAQALVGEESSHISV